MNNVIFLHLRIKEIKENGEIINYLKSGETIAMESLQGWFVDGLVRGGFFEKKVGYCKFSENDNFNKKIGRESSRSTMKTKRLTVVCNDDYGYVKNLVLEDKEGNRYRLLRFKNKKIAHLTEFWKIL